MKNTLNIFLLLCATFLSQALWANSLDVFFTVKRFFDTEKQQQYVELAYLIPGNLVAYSSKDSSNYKAEVLVAIQLLNKDKEAIFDYTYLLQSPSYEANASSLVNLSDLLNISLKEDSLDLSLQFIDLNDSTNYFTDNLAVHQMKQDSAAFMSDIALISEIKEADNSVFVKNGKTLIPKYINYFPSESKQLNFYLEAYNPEKTKNYFVKYFISDENNIIIDKYANFKKLSLQDKEVVLTGFDISKLPSGNYYIYAELRNAQNKIVERKRMYFQRFNKVEEDLDILSYNELGIIDNNFAEKYDLRNITHHLKALKPIADNFEKAAIDGAINSGEIKQMHNYFYSFWSKRDNRNAESLWMDYAKKLKYVDGEFGNTLIEGHETSRGLIYLEYGKPTERLERETRQYGRLEIWTYEQIGQQGNIQFVFVENPSLDNEFPLIHSNLNNQLFNQEWDRILKTQNF